MRIFLSILLLSGFLFESCVNKAGSGSKHSNIQLTKRRAEVLFLGNKGKHHDSGKYAPWLAISLFKEGINLTYTVDGFTRFTQRLSLSYLASGTSTRNLQNGFASALQLSYNTNSWSAWWNESIVDQYYSPATGFVARANAIVSEAGITNQIRKKI